jgi:hypothetical protein
MEPLAAAKWGDLAFSQTFFDDAVTLFFGIRNFSDATYSLYGYTPSPSKSSPWGNPAQDRWYPGEGRTYYGGFKFNMDLDSIRVPTTQDLNRMRTRLYGSLESTLDSVSGLGTRIRNLTSF